MSFIFHGPARADRIDQVEHRLEIEQQLAHAIGIVQRLEQAAGLVAAYSTFL